MLYFFLIISLRKHSVMKLTSKGSYYIILLLECLLLLIFPMLATAQPQQVAKQGILDLRDWDMNEDQIVTLDGEWEMYWGQLLLPSDFQNADLTKRRYVKLPGLWNKMDLPEKKSAGEGVCTYRLLVHLPDSQTVYGLKLNRIETAYKLWINGELHLERGIVGNSLDNMKPAWMLTEHNFKPGSSKIEIVIQVSNFYHRKGGIAHSIYIGTPDAISSLINRLLGFDVFIIGVLLIMGLHHLGLYWLRRNEKAALYFGFTALLTAFYTMVNGQIIIVKILPMVPWEMVVKTNFITNFLRLLTFGLFLHYTFPKEVKMGTINALKYTMLPLALLTMITPARVYTHTLVVFIIIGVTSMLYMVFGIARAVKHHIEGALHSIIGVAIVFLSVINDVLFDFGIINTMYMVPLGVFFFIFFQSYMISLQSSRAFIQSEKLSNQLLFLDKIKNQFLTSNLYKLDVPLRILADNIHATHAALLLYDLDILIIKTTIDSSGETSQREFPIIVHDDRLLPRPRLCYPIIDKCIEEKKSQVVSSALTQPELRENAYILQNRVQSVVCIPLVDQGTIKGVFYAENKLLPGIFTQETIHLVELLVSQLSTLINNSQIYQELEELNRTLEEKVEQRTAEVFQQKEEIETQRDEIEAKNEILSKAFEEITIKNRDITDSIKYAKRIQESILAPEEEIKQLFNKSFIYFKPRDILSGDFYWMERISEATADKPDNEKIMVAAVDCTGHGVPGALMSIIGYNLINYAVNELGATSPAEILSILEKGIKQKLRQTDRTSVSKDGMDMSLIVYEPFYKRVTYAGAHNPVYLIRAKTQKIEILEPNRFSIGGFSLHKVNKNFREITCEIEPNDMVYMFTDGFADQIGGPNNRKYMYPNFRNLLEKNYTKDIEIQPALLSKALESWKQGLKQIDDILVIGVKF